jgi:hypothetical protein
MFAYDEKLDELKRELNRREMLYPAHMRADLLSGHEGQRRINLLKEIIYDYEVFIVRQQSPRHNNRSTKYGTRSRRQHRPAAHCPNAELVDGT